MHRVRRQGHHACTKSKVNYLNKARVWPAPLQTTSKSLAPSLFLFESMTFVVRSSQKLRHHAASRLA
jgi:hypothetical protein